jgi:hypothetical protein
MRIPTPNAWGVAAVAAVLGAALGAGSAVVQSTMRPWQIGGFRVAAGDRRAVGGRDTAGQVEVAQTVHDFGTIGVGSTGSHAFVIRNVGTGPLRLTRGASSCTCTIAGFAADGPAGGESPGASSGDGQAGDRDAGDREDRPEKIVAPGESTRIVLEWKGRGADGPFRQQATILTNDPRRPEVIFVVEGTLVPTWKAEPETLLFSQLSATGGETGEIRIFTYGAAAPEIDRVSIDHGESADRFRVTTSPLEAADIAAQAGATGGLRVTVEALPGLPLGSLRGRVVLELRMPELVTVEVPLEGTVTGDLSVVGVAWNRSRQSLFLGTVSAKTGFRTQVFLTARGPHRDLVRPVVREVVPPSLEIHVGDSEPVGSGSVIRTPIEIVIPPGSPAANHLCSQLGPAGRIVLETGHPDSPTLTIPVCVAIGP